MKLEEWMRGVAELVFVPQCLACGIRLESRLTDSRDCLAFCEKCEQSYRDALFNSCAVCNRPLSECLCASDFMKKNGLSRLVKMFRYLPQDANAVQNNLIYSLKRKRTRRAVEFCAKSLGGSVQRLVPHYEEWTVTFAPRSQKMRRYYGHDQSELIAMALADYIALPYEDLLVRDKSAKVQKELNRNERLANMRGKYAVRRGIDLHGKKILLVDDVVTSGATMLAAAKALRRAGASAVIGVTVGIAYRQITALQINRMERKYALKEVKRLRRQRKHLKPVAAKREQTKEFE